MAADVVDGGEGVDTIESDYSSRFVDVDPPVAITLAGGADDGRPGENDDLRSVERLTLSVPGRIVGSDSPEYVKLHQVGGDGELIGNGGDDELRAGDGADRIDGGAGADKLDGGFGDDTIAGGPGRDAISADLAGGDCGPLWCKYPYGNDVVDARDGEADTVDCGPGEDRVTADANDVLSGCESVDRIAAAPDVPSIPGPAPSGRPGLVASFRRPSRLALTARRRGTRVVVTGRLVPGAGSCRDARVKLALTGARGRTLARRTVRLGASCRVSASLRARGPRRVLRVRASFAGAGRVPAAPARRLTVR
jgi:hypothetical protein